MQVALSCNLGTKLVHGYFISGKTNEQDRFLHCEFKFKKLFKQTKPRSQDSFILYYSVFLALDVL
jgi:hypothetical protein